MSKINDANVVKMATQTAAAYTSNNDKAQVDGVNKSKADTKPVSAPGTAAAKDRTRDSSQEEAVQYNEQQKRINDLDNDALTKAVEEANKQMAMTKKDFEFSIHEDTKKIMLKVKDADTGDIIREIPSEKVLDMVAKVWEFAGLLVDEKR